MPQHTPGPWTYHRGSWGFHGDPDEDSGFHFLLGGEEASGVEEIIGYADMLYPDDGQQYEEAEANARLIAAAPDLLAALEAWLAWDGEIRETPSPRIMAEAAIAKAKGE